jgi:pimeloyl-ACP methyl ester carboxylesterase
LWHFGFGCNPEVSLEKNFTIKSKQLACTLEGDPEKPPIILIHGLASHRGVWHQTLAELKSNHYCIAVDLLGFGSSDKPEGGDYSIAAQGQRILMLADQLGIKTFSLIGHAMGAQIALYIAAILAPQRVQKLVSIAATVTGLLSSRVEKVNIPLYRSARKWPWLYGIANSMINFRPFVNNIFKPWFYNMNGIPFDTWETDRKAAFNPACKISSDESWKAIHSLDLTQHLRKIRAKTLIISGRQDGTVNLDQALLAQTLIPDNDLAIIEKCGHYLMVEKPAHYLKALGLIFQSPK